MKKRVIFGIVLFLFIGFFAFTFANPNEKVSDENKAVYEKNDWYEMDRNPSGSGRNSDDGIWNLPGRDGGSSDKGCKYLYGVYWNWIKKWI